MKERSTKMHQNKKKLKIQFDESQSNNFYAFFFWVSK